MKVNLSYEYNSMFQHYFITLFIFVIIITLLQTYLSPKTAEHWYWLSMLLNHFHIVTAAFIQS